MKENDYQIVVFVLERVICSLHLTLLSILTDTRVSLLLFIVFFHHEHISASRIVMSWVRMSWVQRNAFVSLVQTQRTQGTDIRVVFSKLILKATDGLWRNHTFMA